LTGGFFRRLILFFLIKNYNFLEVAFTFLDQFPVLLLILMTFWGKSISFYTLMKFTQSQFSQTSFFLKKENKYSCVKS